MANSQYMFGEGRGSLRVSFVRGDKHGASLAARFGHGRENMRYAVEAKIG